MSLWTTASQDGRPEPAGSDSTAAPRRLADEPIRVLIVDDDPEDRLIIRRFLRAARTCRFAVQECVDAEGLAGLLDAMPVDVILMDQRLGEQQGTDLIRRIGGSRAAAPSILLTGSDDADLEEEAIVSGAAEHLNKADLSTRTLERTIKYVVKWHSDQQELRRQGEQLQLAWSEAASANRAKSVFLASMSHELRTPLNAIIGFSSMLLSGTVTRRPTRVRDYARSILEGGQQLLHLVDNLLDIARIEAGQFLVGDETLDVVEILAGAVRMNEPLARQRGVDVSFAPPARLPAVRADQAALQQIFLNLLSNATKYTRAGGSVAVGVEPVASTLRVTVRDTGIGMTADEVETALRPFMRLRHNAYVRTTDGAGLGLAIVAALVEQLDLDLEFVSEPEKGTTVTVTIPRERLERTTSAQSP